MDGVVDRGTKGWMDERWGSWTIEVRGLLFLPKTYRIVPSISQPRLRLASPQGTNGFSCSLLQNSVVTGLETPIMKRSPPSRTTPAP